MSINIPADLQDFLSQQIADGVYASTDEAVRDALCVLRVLTARRDQLRADVQLGIDDAARGLAGLLDVEALIERCTHRLAAEGIAD
jgi:putative addiction module CopG family antidote